MEQDHIGFSDPSSRYVSHLRLAKRGCFFSFSLSFSLLSKDFVLRDRPPKHGGFFGIFCFYLFF